jgi:hypothetical protein
MCVCMRCYVRALVHSQVLLDAYALEFEGLSSTLMLLNKEIEVCPHAFPELQRPTGAPTNHIEPTT